MHGLDQQQHEAADHRADDGAEVRHQIRHADHDGHKPDILHAADQHKDRIGSGDDQRVQQGLTEVADKDRVAAQDEVEKGLVCVLPQERPHQPPEAAHDAVFLQQDIDREDYRDHGGQDPLAGVGDDVEDTPGVFTDKAGDRAHGVLRQGLQLRVVDDQLQRPGLDQAAERRGVVVKILRKKQDAPRELRDQHAQQKRQRQQRRQEGEPDGERPARLAQLAFGKQPVIEEPRQRIEDVREDKGQKDSLEVSEKAADRRQHRPEIGQQHIERDADAGDHRAGVPLLFRQIFEAHAIISFSARQPRACPRPQTADAAFLL